MTYKTFVQSAVFVGLILVFGFFVVTNVRASAPSGIPAKQMVATTTQVGPQQTKEMF